MSAIDNPQALAHPGPAAPPAVALPPGPGAAAPTFGAGDIWRLVKQRKVLILATFTVLYALVVAGTIAIWRLAPLYTSSALIQYVPPAEGFKSFERQILPKDFIQQQLTTVAAQLKTPETLLDLLGQEVVKGTPFYRSYGEGEKALAKMLNDLQSDLAAAPIRDSYLVKVSFATPVKSDATLIINTLLDRFVRNVNLGDVDSSQRKLNLLRDNRARVEQQLETVRVNIANLRAQRDLPALRGDRDVQAETIAMLNNTKQELLARRVDIESQLANVSGMDPRNVPLSAEMKLFVEADPVLRYYRQQVEALDIQIEVAERNIIGRSHPQMQVLVANRDGYKQREGARREELIDDYKARQVEALRQERARVNNMLGQVQEQISTEEARRRDVDDAIQRLESLLKDESRVDRELEQMSLALNEAEQQHSMRRDEGRYMVVSRPKDAILPSRPNFVLYLGGGFVLCGLAALGLAFLREFTDQAVRTPVDVGRHGALAVLGSVPLLDDEEADVDAIEVATRRAPQSLVAESFRQIRTHLMFSGPAESQRTLLITSPRPEEGKTAVAVNLAVTLAQGGKRVLLIDCNFRRPALRRLFSGTRAEGLSNVLVGRARLADLVTRTELGGLEVLSSGPMPPNPAELLGSPAMRELIAQARQAYGHVILDGPPSLLVSDALLLAMQVDAVIVVVRAGATAKGALRRCREQFQRMGARVIGAVLNGAQARPGGYFRQQYREFYDYTSEESSQELPAGEMPELDLPADDEPQR